MKTVATISRTELARNTRRTIERVRRGETILVRSFGEEQVAILDINNYRILQAISAYRLNPQAPVSDQDKTPAGLDEEQVKAIWRHQGAQAAWNRVIHAYLDGDISLGRAAHLLGMNRFELQARFNRLGVPQRTAPTDEAGIAADAWNLQG